MAGSMYKRKSGIGQYRSITNSTFRGLNLYNETTTIADELLSDAWEARPGTKNESVLLGTIISPEGNSYYPPAANGVNRVLCNIADTLADGDEHWIVISHANVSGTNTAIETLTDYNLDHSSATSINISAYGFIQPVGASRYVNHMCIFYTEANRYVCFVSPSTKKLLVYNYTTTEVITLPFYPKNIITHSNRLYCIDTFNKLWWCRAGDFRTWYGMPADDDYVVTSTAMLDSTAYTIAAQPTCPMYLSFTVTKTSTIDTLGTLAIVGTSSLDASLSETVTPIDGIVYSKYAYKTITSITATGHSAVAGADMIKIGVSIVAGGFVQDDAGYWTLEEERTLVGIAELGDNLYIFSDQNIYVFQGFSYDTFSLNKIHSDIHATGVMTTYGGLIYFIAKHDELYEFNGSSFPTIINRPVYTNGAISNGIYGGIYDTISTLNKGNGCLYVNCQYKTTYLNVDVYDVYQYFYYMFDIKSRTWWKRAAQTLQTIHNGYAEGYFLDNVADDDVYFCGIAKTAGEEYTYGMFRSLGTTKDGKSYIVTKSFSSGVTDDLTLTELSVLIRDYWAPYSESYGYSLNIYYSTNSWRADDGASTWTLLKTVPATEWPQDIAPITVYLAGSEIARANHFRIKIEVVGDVTLEILGIERRYRVMKRSR